jgi:hypothetical protein
MVGYILIALLSFGSYIRFTETKWLLRPSILVMLHILLENRILFLPDQRDSFLISFLYIHFSRIHHLYISPSSQLSTRGTIHHSLLIFTLRTSPSHLSPSLPHRRTTSSPLPAPLRWRRRAPLQAVAQLARAGLIPLSRGSFSSHAGFLHGASRPLLPTPSAPPRRAEPGTQQRRRSSSRAPSASLASSPVAVRVGCGRGHHGRRWARRHPHRDLRGWDEQGLST